MVRVSETLKKSLPVATGVVAGALLTMSLAGAPADAATKAAAGVQDPAVQMQIQQALNNFQVQLQTQLNLMQSEIDTLEREQQNMRLRLDGDARERLTAPAPIPADPLPGTTTFGRLVSESSEAYRFELQSARGDLLGQLGMTSDGPGLLLFDASGRISTALLATPAGPELRMVDAEGTLQTVLSGSR
jgi:hypothetical protein